MPEEAKYKFGAQLGGLTRCPHCSIAHPTMPNDWGSDSPIKRATPGPVYSWVLYHCTSCGGCVLARGEPDVARGGNVTAIYPPEKVVHEDIPQPAARFLQQAFDTLSAPDAAAVMAGSAVDGMLKHLGYTHGSLYTRIDKAVEDHVLTKAMGDWAHEVRLGSNRPRHADEKHPHVTAPQAEQSVEFAEALGFFLFVLSKRIERGLEAAKNPAPKKIIKQISKAPAPIPR
jgi:hypothetical protein